MLIGICPTNQKKDLRRQGGQQLALRLYDVTDIDLNSQGAHSVQEYLCDELAREWYLPIPVSDRDYVINIGYRCADGRWLVLARSPLVRIPPVYPSDWIEDIFVTVNWEEELVGKTVYELVPPSKRYGSSTRTTGKPYLRPNFRECRRYGGRTVPVPCLVPCSTSPVPYRCRK
jgi:hypothetical protein